MRLDGKIIQIIPAPPGIFARYFRNHPDEFDFYPVVAWLYHEPVNDRHYLHGFTLNGKGEMTLCEQNDNFDRYTFKSS